MDRAAGQRCTSRIGGGSRPVDGSGRAPQPPPAMEILLAEWRTGVYFRGQRRGRTVHHHRLPILGVPRRHSPLAVFHALAEASTSVEPGRTLDVWVWHDFGDFWRCSWNLD